MHTTADPNEQHVVNFVPDEICVVTAANTRIDDVSAFYERVRTQLNLRITALLKVSATGDRPDTAGPLGPDLVVNVLARRFADDPAVLQPLRRVSPEYVATSTPQTPTLTPFISLRNGNTNHLYFALGTDSPPVGKMDLARLRLGLDSVRELVLLLNRFGLSDSDGFTIRAFAPNWLTTAHQFGCGCPAGVPLPFDGKQPRFPFQFRGDLAAVLEQPAVGEVVVAVLDTAPTQAALDAAAGDFPGNELLNQVHKNVGMDSPSLSPAGFAAHLAGCLPRLQFDMQSGPVHDHPDQFAMPDHGLFVTGILHDALAGRATVHLIRVLDDSGIGDLFTITHALAALPSQLKRSDSARLVVNLSLGIDLPIPARFLDRWFPQAANNLKTLREHGSDIAELLDLLHLNLQDAIQSLTDQGILVVASSGNDALRPDVDPGDPPPPRFPARYDEVLAVAATRRDLRSPANYSNRGELSAQQSPGDLASFGGSVVPAPTPNAPATTDPADSLIGIFSSKTLPGGAPAQNTSGWVRWAGTSFSTPLVAAAAARLWSIKPELGPLDVVKWLRTFANQLHAGADPNAPIEVPALDVTQMTI